MAEKEYKNEHEEEQEGALGGVKTNLTFGSVASSVFGLFVATGSLAAKIVTGDVLGAAEVVSSTLSLVSKAAGLSPVIDKAGKYLKEKFADSKALGFAGKVWGVVTSRPFKMAYRAFCMALIAAAIVAGTVNPVTGPIALTLAAGTMLISTAAGSRSIGRNNRIAKETKSLKEAALAVGEPEKGKCPALDALLISKLAKNKTQDIDGANIGASVARGSILESAALILEAAGDADNLVGVAAAGVAVFGGLAGEAKEAIERQEKRNRLLADREEARVKVVCAALAKEPGIDKLSSQTLEKKYNEVYKANFQQSFGTKTKNFFKDIGAGAGEYIFGGLKKVFAKNEEHVASVDVHTKQQVAEVAQDLQKKRTVDGVETSHKQIPTHIEVVTTDHSTPAPTAKQGHHSLDPHYMETHTHIDKTEHSPHLGEGGGKAIAPRTKAR